MTSCATGYVDPGLNEVVWPLGQSHPGKGPGKEKSSSTCDLDWLSSLSRKRTAWCWGGWKWDGERDHDDLIQVRIVYVKTAGHALPSTICCFCPSAIAGSRDLVRNVQNYSSILNLCFLSEGGGDDYILFQLQWWRWFFCKFCGLLDPMVFRSQGSFRKLFPFVSRKKSIGHPFGVIPTPWPHLRNSQRCWTFEKCFSLLMSLICHPVLKEDGFCSVFISIGPLTCLVWYSVSQLISRWSSLLLR